MSTRIALIGYGKMGKMLAGMAADHDCEVVACIDPHACEAKSEISAENLNNCDVCLEFSHPAAVMNNLKALISLGQTVVVGTTGWNQHEREIRELVEKAGTGLLTGANFSIGMSIFSRVVQSAACFFDKFESYDVFGYEQHHRQKADSPSGTAIELAKLIIESSSRKELAFFETAHRKIEPNELHFASIRGGHVPGTHSVIFDSEADSIELIHKAHNRSGFAHGALEAAKWMKGKKGCYNFNDMMNELLC